MRVLACVIGCVLFIISLLLIFLIVYLFIANEVKGNSVSSVYITDVGFSMRSWKKPKHALNIY